MEFTIKALRHAHLQSTLGRMVIPTGVSKWYLVTDSTMAGAQAIWSPVPSEGWHCLAAFEVTNVDGMVKVDEIEGISK